MHEKILVQSVYGNVLAFEGDLITKQIQEFGGHTRPEFSFATSALAPSMNVFDIGAHIGTFSLAALKKMAPESRLLAVEGNPTTFDVLTQNLPDRTTAICALIGTAAGMAYFEKPGNTGAGRLMRADHVDGFQKVNGSAKTVSIDQLAAEHFVPDYIKLDVEGAEYDALAGSEVVAEHKPIIYTEVSQGGLRAFGRTRQQMDDLLRGLGYKFFFNTFDRNGAHDFFRVKALPRLTLRPHFDVLCVHSSTEFCDVLSRASRGITLRDKVIDLAKRARVRLKYSG